MKKLVFAFIFALVSFSAFAGYSDEVFSFEPSNIDPKDYVESDNPAYGEDEYIVEFEGKNYKCRNVLTNVHFYKRKCEKQ